MYIYSSMPQEGIYALEVLYRNFWEYINTKYFKIVLEEGPKVVVH